MNDEILKMTTNKKLASYRILGWIGTYTKGDICAILGFTRPTLERRLKLHNWKYSEIESITRNMPFLHDRIN
jgi:hypothetical protein